jgi:branched-chain amino acid transport system permease protein
MSYEIAFIALIGGRGTILGPILGALLLRPVSELTRIYIGDMLPGLHLVIFGLVLIIVMRYYPKGLVEPVTRILNKYVIRRFSKPDDLKTNSAADQRTDA